MPHTPHLLTTHLDALRVVAARAQAVLAVAADYFYGYWFSHRRA